MSRPKFMASRKSSGVRRARPTLSREQIATTGLALVDQQGIEGLSMRALGTACGVKAMSLYRYVSNKDDLLDAIQAIVVSQMDFSGLDTQPWRAGLEGAAREFRRVLALHPHAIILFVRPAATVPAYEALERVWRLLIQAGFSELDALRAFQSVLAFVIGQALWQFTPTETRAVDDEFEFGLSVMLGGLEARLAGQG